MKRTMISLAAAAALATSLFGCKEDAKTDAPKPNEGIKVAPAAGGAAEQPQAGGQPAVHGQGGGDQAGGSSASGKVAETMDAGGYTYVKLEAAGGEIWAAVRQTPIKVGDEVTVVNAMIMKGFHSKTLNRDFDQILFGELAAGGAVAGEAGKAGATDIAAVHGGAEGKPVELTEPVAKAEGDNAYTVAELHAKKGELADKEILVRGRVTKYNPGIMGKNWVHLQDGSGSPEGKDFDLTVTTDGDVAVGDVVTVKGPVHLDRDFGAGYKYGLIIEEAAVTK